MRAFFFLLLAVLSVAAQEPVKPSAVEAVPKKAAPVPAKLKVEPYPSVPQVEAALRKTVAYARANLSFAGGYATKWSRDLKESRTSDTKGTSLISIEAPGTPMLGLVFLKAWQATGDKLHLQAAREAAGALL